MKLIKTTGFAILLLLFTALGSGLGWFYARQAGATALPSEPPPAAVSDAQAPAPIFMALEPFTVTLAGDDIDRILHVAITVRLQDQESLDRLERYKPEARSRVLQTLAQQPADSIGQASARQELALAVAASLAPPFQPLTSKQNILDILFTEFVVQ